MIKRAMSLMICLLFFSSVSFAQGIYLKNGKKIEGKIVEQSDDEVKIEVQGIVLTYFSDEIERIEQENLPQPIGAKELKPFSPNEKPPLPRAPVKTKKELILELMDASGATNNTKLTLNNMLRQAPAEHAELIRQFINVDEIILEIVPIYERLFTESELQEIIRFYKSSIGHKLLRVTPQIIQESSIASQKYLERKLQDMQ